MASNIVSRPWQWIVCIAVLVILMAIIAQTGRFDYPGHRSRILVMPGRTTTFTIKQDYESALYDADSFFPESAGWGGRIVDHAWEGESWGSEMWERRQWTIHLFDDRAGSTRVEITRSYWPIW